MAGLLPYQHVDLANNETDIRLVRLHPGQFDDSIHLTITHTSLAKRVQRPMDPNANNVKLEQLRDTMPEGWEPMRNLDGRWFFLKQGSTLTTTWTHPDPLISPSLYAPEKIAWDDKSPEYEALSYTWGSDAAQDKAIIKLQSTFQADIDDPQRAFPIRANLSDALRHLRLEDRVRTLWIDAICICQENVVERNEQVRRMGEIFEHASRTVFWLGKEADDSSRAMMEFERIGSQIVYVLPDFLMYPAPDATDSKFFGAEYKPPEETWTAIRAVLKRAWFRRRWIVQEVHLGGPSSILCCGNCQISWTIFRLAAAYLLSRRSMPQSMQDARIIFFHLAFGISRGSFTQTLQQQWYKECSDERDKVYALLEILLLRDRLRPDYTLSTLEVYRSALLQDIYATNHLSILRLGSVAGRVLTGPSWIPDLVGKLPFFSTLPHQFSSGFSAANIRYEEPDKLIIPGIECSAVRQVSPPNPADATLALKSFEEWISSDLVGWLNLANEETLETVIRTICCDYTSERLPSGGVVSFEQWKHYILQINSFGLEWDAGKIFKHHIHPASVESFMKKLEGRSFFMTECGKLGVCPRETQTGDIICVALGLASPLILRPVNDAAFQVLGECFVSELEDSISFLGPLPVGWRVEFPRRARSRGSIYVNDAESVRTMLDPRLGALEGWVPTNLLPDGVEDEVAVVFANKTTGVLINYDPRLTAEALTERGVPIKWFCLV